MPVFRSGDEVPAWCELEHFEIVTLPAGAARAFERAGRSEKLIVVKGYCRIRGGALTVEGFPGANVNLESPEGQFEVLPVPIDTTVVRMAGRWQQPTGGSGPFAALKSDSPQDGGDPVAYPKTTNFDSHYHDCDEYWIIVAGRLKAVSEGKHYDMTAGDCLATGAGHHHDIAEVLDPVVGVYFETTLEDKKRYGHLWNHTHGEANPKAERV